MSSCSFWLSVWRHAPSWQVGTVQLTPTSQPAGDDYRQLIETRINYSDYYYVFTTIVKLEVKVASWSFSVRLFSENFTNGELFDAAFVYISLATKNGKSVFALHRFVFVTANWRIEGGQNASQQTGPFFTIHIIANTSRT